MKNRTEEMRREKGGYLTLPLLERATKKIIIKSRHCAVYN